MGGHAMRYAPEMVMEKDVEFHTTLLRWIICGGAAIGRP